MQQDQWESLSRQLSGELYLDNAMRTVYATDASAYREKPQAVAIPRNVEDIRKLISFAREYKTTLIPRAAGTSLAGQVVGSGIVVDISRHFNQILEVNTQERWVCVQPGVVRDELNLFLASYGLMFGPETSTANRAMIGGMVGNNSCGLHSVIYGATRDHLLSVKAILSDGSEVEFSALSQEDYAEKCGLSPTASVAAASYTIAGAETIAAKPRTELKESGSAESFIYQKIHALLSHPANQQEIRTHFPREKVTRRNTGYALDSLLDCEPFTEGGQPFNLCRLIAGSEGTLCFVTEIKLNLLPLPPREVGVVCVHCHSIHESLKANLIAMQHGPGASELVDKYIMDFTKGHPEYDQNRFFIQGDPQAMLMVEFTDDNLAALQQKTAALIAALRKQGLGYAHPVIYGADTKKVWDVRKAGLGLIRNIIGDAQPVNLIEDCAVAVEDLPDYIAELETLLQGHGIRYSMYAHAGAGELHVEPMINLKSQEGNAQFRQVLAETAQLVKKYGGSLSGEHGDGRLRGEFIPYMVGEKNYKLFEEIKRTFDPENIFNPGKIVNTPPMNEHLRYTPGQGITAPATIFNFSEKGDILGMAEACSGSGDCRKSHLMGGTMCPSYMATKNEKDTTRARANILREMLTRSEKANKFDHEEIKVVMDLCLSCKGCKAECPSNVDVGKLKAEWQQHYYQANGVPLRTWLVANFTTLNKLASLAPWAYNFLFSNSVTSSLFKRLTGFAPQRSLPLLEKTTLSKWMKQRKKRGERSEERGVRNEEIEGKKPETNNRQQETKRVYLFCDEFTEFNDVEIGKQAVELLERLGYEVVIPEHKESGRTYLSKGLVKRAQQLATTNVSLLKDLVSEHTPLLGIEPSAILTFRDEYLSLVPDSLKASATALAKHSLLIEEFLAKELEKGHLTKEQFTTGHQLIKLHGHCHQKALSSLVPLKKLLSLPKNYQVQLNTSGCCGMAGSFGYEKNTSPYPSRLGNWSCFLP